MATMASPASDAAEAPPRPPAIDTSPRGSSSRASSAISYRHGPSSPRIELSDGDIPPTLSPLDALAAHSMKLARELEETRKAGERRMSRLPPAIVTQALIEHHSSRPHFFRSFPETSDLVQSPTTEKDASSGNSPAVVTPRVRPLSEYPLLSGVTSVYDDVEVDDEHTPRENASLTLSPPKPTALYFDALRAASPEPMDEALPHTTKPDPAEFPQSTLRLVSNASQPDLVFTLSPPKAAFARKTVDGHDSSDEERASSNGGSTFSQNRALSSNSGASLPRSPRSPRSPFVPSHARSQSGNSDLSVNDILKTRSHLNFSRPLSSASLNAQLLSRKQSYSSVGSITRAQALDIPRGGIGSAQTSFDDARSESPEGYMSRTAESYTYGKFSLPRGRMVSRDSTVFSALSTPHFQWQEPLFPHSPPRSAASAQTFDLTPLTKLDAPRPTRSFDSGTRRPSFLAGFSFKSDSKRPGTSAGVTSRPERRRPHTPPPGSSQPEARRPAGGGFSFEFGSEKALSPQPSSRAVLGASPQQSSRERSTPSPSHSIQSTRSPSGVQWTPIMPSLPPPAVPVAFDRSSISESTIRPQTGRSVSTYLAFSAEHHVTKAIELHQRGELAESTYHLRIAAKQNHATGMLLYALACRHGWGRRPNPTEAVVWLKKAVDGAMLEVADDEEVEEELDGGNNGGSPAPKKNNKKNKVRSDFLTKRAHRAQFALSIYELGVCHLNGWGTEQDKALALRCFEIAGSWGDADALTEAGFCYAQGIGCKKKDLRKAARLYREAEAKGVSMVGNSWIYKAKYDDNAGDDKKKKNKKGDSRKDNGTAAEGEAAEAERPLTRGRSADGHEEERNELKDESSARKPRDKSRTRSFFSRKKLVVTVD